MIDDAAPAALDLDFGRDLRRGLEQQGAAAATYLN
jgi:hypothetical protein